MYESFENFLKAIQDVLDEISDAAELHEFYWVKWRGAYEWHKPLGTPARTIADYVMWQAMARNENRSWS